MKYTEGTNTIFTAGEVGPHGEIIEQTANGQLLFWDPAQGVPRIAPSITWEETVYEPIPLEPAMKQAIRFPVGVEAGGTAQDLVQDLALELEGDAPARLCSAIFIMGTWLFDVLPAPLVLNVWGQEGQERRLVSKLSPLCRRALPIAIPSLAELSRLPRGLSPTLILRPNHDRALQPLLAAAAASAGVLQKGRLLHLHFPLIVCTRQPLRVPALSIPLSLISSCRPISRSEAERLATRYQPRLLDFRLCHHQQVTASEFDVPDFASEMHGVAMALGAVVEGEPGLQAQLVEALRVADDGWKAVHAEAGGAIALEALLVACHQHGAEIYLHEIAATMNAIVMARRGDQVYTTKDAGKILRKELGLFPEKLEFGNGLKSKGGLPKRIHQLAAAHHTFSSQKPLVTCTLCTSFAAGKEDAAPPPALSAGDVTDVQGVQDIQAVPDVQKVQKVQEVQEVQEPQVETAETQEEAAT